MGNGLGVGTLLAVLKSSMPGLLEILGISTPSFLRLDETAVGVDHAEVPPVVEDDSAYSLGQMGDALWSTAGNLATGTVRLFAGARDTAEEYLGGSETSVSHAVKPIVEELRAARPRASVEPEDAPMSFSSEHMLAGIAGMPEADQQAMWETEIASMESGGTLQALRDRGISIPHNISNYAAFQAYLRRAGIQQPNRINSIHTALEVASNNLHMNRLDPSLPTTVVIAPVEDHNEAFTATRGFPLLDTLVQQPDDRRMNVIYIEAATDREAMQALARVYRRTGRRIDTVVFAGHGSRNRLSLGASDPQARGEGYRGAERYDIDSSDFADGDFGALSRVIAEDGQVVMWSCSNGAPLPTNYSVANEENLAQSMSLILPGRRIIASPIDSNIASLQVAENNRFDVQLHGGEGSPRGSRIDPVIYVDAEDQSAVAT